MEVIRYESKVSLLAYIYNFSAITKTGVRMKKSVSKDKDKEKGI